METIFTKIQAQSELPRLSKHEQLVSGIINAIDDKILFRGSMLPSVNVMVNELGFARKTIVKAYNDLKERGLVESKNRLGYFVVNDSTNQQIKVALILFAFHSFQEKFYNTFRKNLGPDIQLEIFFHHNNIRMLKSILDNITGQYGMYIVAPIPGKRTKKVLSDIPVNKLLLVDRYLDMGETCSYVVQRFKNPMLQTLESLHQRLSDFKRYVLFFKEKTDYPRGILKAYKLFMSAQEWEFDVLPEYESGALQKNTVYFTINDNDLWELLKDVEQSDMELGKDIGILSHNDNTIKTIISGGISTFSTDFKAMARVAADFVKKREPIQQIIPSVLIRRTSL